MLFDLVAKLKEELDPYYHVGIKVIPLDALEFDVQWRDIIKAHVPVLNIFLTGDKDYVISVDYKYYVNYS